MTRTPHGGRLLTAGHWLKGGDIVVLTDGRSGHVVFYLIQAEAHPVRGFVAWVLIENAGASPAEVEAAWRLWWGPRRRRGRLRWHDRLAVRPEQISHVIPRLVWRSSASKS